MTIAEKLEAEIRELAVTDWEKFKAVTGFDITSYSVCQLREQKKSMQRIANILGISKIRVQRACEKCLS